ncbi:L,D-transpeptidase family protein [Segetibacter koreensis]|uniref:L,D-transpeptidase family protein n=1 Tax=Segetibacter koreensis TaxID=398037 RepID=UPI00037D4949|nr:L,D-transpeptidase family protein [Segetibacter koreensis]
MPAGRSFFMLLLLMNTVIINPFQIIAQNTVTNYAGYTISLRDQLNKIGTNNFYHGKMVYEFYEENELKWFSSYSNSANRNNLLNLLANADLYALNPGSYHYTFLEAKKVLTNIEDTINAELFYTDAALSFMHDLAYGGDYNFVQYNAVKYHPDNLDLISALRLALTSKNFVGNLIRVEPTGDKYNCLKQEYVRMLALYKRQDFKDVVIRSKEVKLSNVNLVIKLRQLGYLNEADTTIKGLAAALEKFQRQYLLPVQSSIKDYSLKILNEPIEHKLEALRWNIRWYRWLNLMKDRKFISINIPANRLTFFDSGITKLESRMVVGKTSTPTPTLISEIKNVIYYPYWNVPYSIATKEILPVLKRNRGYLQVLDLEVLYKGNVIASSGINWSAYSVSNFPFRLRQRPGCNNSLGRLKFDFDNPYHVYIHDTNVKLGFLAKRRFFSHGCMRVEKPFELAVALGVPPEKIDLSECLEDKKPEIIPLPKAVAVFVIYATIDVVNGELQWHDDEYHKIRKLK